MNEHQQDHDDLHAAPTGKISVRAGEQAGRSDDPAATTRLATPTSDAVAPAPVHPLHHVGVSTTPPNPAPGRPSRLDHPPLGRVAPARDHDREEARIAIALEIGARPPQRHGRSSLRLQVHEFRLQPALGRGRPVAVAPEPPQFTDWVFLPSPLFHFHVLSQKVVNLFIIATRSTPPNTHLGQLSKFGLPHQSVLVCEKGVLVWSNKPLLFPLNLQKPQSGSHSGH